MATQTPNFNFDLRESADIFNPLSTNANFESLDTILKNLQETGGITTYTTTAAANLLKLSGTPKVNDTVFKFVAAGDANTWTAATGGVINNIVALDGKRVTIKGGNMYVAWVNSANAMVCVAWPDVVNAQTFDGKGPNEWASKAQLDTVNQTAANATQTAQAAATVANNALEVAQAAGFDPEIIYSAPAGVQNKNFVYNLTKNLDNYKFIMFSCLGGQGVSSSTYKSRVCFIVPTPTEDVSVILSAYVPVYYSADDKRFQEVLRSVYASSRTTFTTELLTYDGQTMYDTMRIETIYGIK